MAADVETGFREFEHSGDVGIEAWGATHAALIENATRGLFGLLVWSGVGRNSANAAGPVVQQPTAPGLPRSALVVPACGRPLDATRGIVVHAASHADVVVDWLNEVVTAAAMHGEVYDDVLVQAADEDSASGTLYGEAFDPARHQRRFDVKAATYHGLVCEKTADGLHARIIFDL